MTATTRAMLITIAGREDDDALPDGGRADHGRDGSPAAAVRRASERSAVILSGT